MTWIMHQQFWGYKVEWKSVSRGTGGKKVEYHWTTQLHSFSYFCTNSLSPTHHPGLPAFPMPSVSSFHSGLLKIKVFKDIYLYQNIVTRLRAGQPGFDSRKGLEFFLRHRVQTGSRVHPASYPMGTRGSFTGVKATGAWSWPFHLVTS
jgi:hypothetical protein